MWWLLLACGVTPQESSAKPGDDSPTTESSPPDPELFTFYADADGDSYGDPNTPIESADQPEGAVEDALDCDDTDPGVHPGAAEVCDAVDQNCDGQVDEGMGQPTYADVDGDGWGAGAEVGWACVGAPGLSLTNTDCDDSDATRSPGAEEVCENGTDEDCNGLDIRCALWGQVNTADADAAGQSDVAGALAGRVVACDADTDGDGTAELFVLATDQFREDERSGQGRLWRHTVPEDGVLDLSSGAALVEGDAEVEFRATNFMASPGDLDGDGKDEFFVGRSLFGGAWPSTASFARAHVRDITADTSEPGSVAPFDEGRFLIGGNYHALGNDLTSTGGVFLLSGLPEGDVVLEDVAVATFTLDNLHEETFLGVGVCAGDLDGDGLSDAVLGAPADSAGDAPPNDIGGAVYVVYGVDAGDHRLVELDGTLRDADAAIRWGGQRAIGGLGHRLACGDFSGDGKGDIIASAPLGYESGLYSGNLFLFHGPVYGALDVGSAIGEVAPERELDHLGYGLAQDLDLDASGRADVVFSSLLEDSDGVVNIFYDGWEGVRYASDADATIGTLEAPAMAPAACPDLDGDGADDLLVGNPGDSTHATWAGAAFLFFGGG